MQPLTNLTPLARRCLCPLLLWAAPWAFAQPTDAWRTVPLVDAHFHLMPFMTPADLLARMDQHRISHTVSAGAIGSPAIGHPNLRDSNAAAAIGPRFLPSVGNAELVNAERVEGPALFTNPDSQERPKALQQIDAFLNRPPRTIGETFPNAERSSADPMRRRRVPLDSPMFQALAEIATRFNRPLPVHMEWHPDSVAGLSRLLERWHTLTLLLSHCGKTTKAADIRVFFDKHPNVVCDLGYRSLPQEASDFKRFPERTLFWASAPGRPAYLAPEWKKLIEDHPDRFMVAIDDTHDWAQYDEVVRSLREGLLAHLDPTVVERVAHANAQRIFRLAP
jgi:Amidohydrolase